MCVLEEGGRREKEGRCVCGGGGTGEGGVRVCEGRRGRTTNHKEQGEAAPARRRGREGRGGTAPPQQNARGAAAHPARGASFTLCSETPREVELETDTATHDVRPPACDFLGQAAC